MNIKFTNKVSLEDSLIFEKEYPENLHWDLDGKQELKDGGVEFVYMVDDTTGELIGEAYFLPLDNMKEWDADEKQTEDGLTPYYDKKFMYAFSTTILKEYQGKGYGKMLKAYCLGLWKGFGFTHVMGHARAGGSIILQLSFGAKIVDKFTNWYQTGEEYYLYMQEL